VERCAEEVGRSCGAEHTDTRISFGCKTELTDATVVGRDNGKPTGAWARLSRLADADGAWGWHGERGNKEARRFQRARRGGAPGKLTVTAGSLRNSTSRQLEERAPEGNSFFGSRCLKVPSYRGGQLVSTACAPGLGRARKPRWNAGGGSGWGAACSCSKTAAKGMRQFQRGASAKHVHEGR
jgi:hypothetical protein